LTRRPIARKSRAGTEALCEWVFRPLAHPVVLALLPLRVPPPAVAAAAGATGLVAAAAIGRGEALAAALLVQLKTVLDNADGQLARASGRISVFGRYLDSELDLLVNVALFAAIGWTTRQPLVAAAAFLALTIVLSINFNLERLYRAEHGAGSDPQPDAVRLDERILRRVYLIVYAPQDRLAERFVDARLRGASPQARRLYHDRATVTVLANLGLSTQLAVLGLCLVAGRPIAFAWLAVCQLGLVALLALRRELLVRNVAQLEGGAA
jgi:archaetidylinositol phosphate synthase